jgi:bifunctional ADP-heptose synthase (sugar kinase/adenylyltransferase)
VNDTALDKPSEKILLKKITKSKSKKDAIIVADFGHGLISLKTARFISKQKNFFGLNAQVNSSTVGYNNISKYLKPKCLVINATELRQELKERDGDLNFLARKLKKIIKAKYLVVTMGRAGAMMIDENNKTILCPAFATDVIDKIGAGDTLFAYLNLFLLAGCDKELSLFIASIAAAETTNTYANSSILNKINLKKSVHYLLK